MNDPYEARAHAIGLGSREAPRASWLLRRASTALERLGHDDPSRAAAFWIPGRIEVLGKHTDYAGGRSLLVAAERGFCMLVAPRDEARLRIADARLDETVELSIDATASVANDWSRYPSVVARRLARDFGALRGADIALAGDLPMAAGMSGSSALVVATFLALAESNGLRERESFRRHVDTDGALAGYLGATESGAAFGELASDGGVGTHGGSQDHTAILFARSQALVRWAFHPARFERTVPLPPEVTFVVASSGVVAEKALAARERYNAIAAKARAIVRRWRATTGFDDDTLAAVARRDPSGDEARRVLRDSRDADFEPRHLLERLDHFLLESETLIPDATEALARGDLRAFGDLADRSQEAAERLLGNQVPETIALAREARALGAVAASAFGAGFGGSVWALVDAGEADAFAAEWRARYVARFPERDGAAEVFVTGAGPAATRLW